MIYLDIAQWLWEQFGRDATRFAKAKWGKFNWNEAERKYREKLIETYSTTRLLGHNKPINVTEIFTDVYVLDKLTAHRRFGLKELPDLNEDLEGGIKRKPALRLATSQNKLFILGKPGAGKTTFLKYLTLKACEGKIKKTPIFISLKEWSDSDETLEAGLDNYLIRLFDICSFPNAKVFINHLLEHGKALILFDGLDEVKQEGNIRSKIIALVNDFSKKYSKNQIFITCRLAATEYMFENFTYVEIADFNFSQTSTFVKKWFQGQPLKSEKFLRELKKPENKGFLELTKTPLLLTLLCLAYDELLEFPDRRVDLYKEAFDALLKKWDASRGIHRDDIYRGLSTLRKENLLSRIAYQNFEKKKFFFKQEEVSSQISEYLSQLPLSNGSADILDGQSVLKAIEAQHGLIVERAYGIYSFSHLTFQEYLTARYIVQNSGAGTLRDLAQNMYFDQWSEVISISASLLDNADIFIGEMFLTLKSFVTSKELANLFRWISVKSEHISNVSELRAVLLLWQIFKSYKVLNKQAKQLALSHTNANDLNDLIRTKILVKEALVKNVWIAQQVSTMSALRDVANDCNQLYLFEATLTKDYDDLVIEQINAKLMSILVHLLDISITDIEKQFTLSQKDYKNLLTILDGTITILKSLELAIVTDRKKLKDLIFYISV